MIIAKCGGLSKIKDFNLNLSFYQTFSILGKHTTNSIITLKCPKNDF